MNNLPKQTERTIPLADDMRNNIFTQRRRIAKKLANPRLLQIHLHTFRHWKGTTEYHRTKDIPHVMQTLGHKSIKNTLVHTHLADDS